MLTAQRQEREAELAAWPKVSRKAIWRKGRSPNETKLLPTNLRPLGRLAAPRGSFFAVGEPGPFGGSSLAGAGLFRRRVLEVIEIPTVLFALFV